MANLDAIKKIGVIGSGQMGRGIAQVAAGTGIDVIMLDANRALADKGKATIAGGLGKLVEKGKINAADRDKLLERLHPAEGYAALGDADFVVEAAVEAFDLKKQIFGELDKAVRPGIILATNTSSISITAIGAATKRPDKVIGMHFMNPVPVLKLCEIIRGLPTSDETYETTRALAQKLGKTVTTSRDVPGFIANRILMPMLNEACYVLYEGIANREDVDTTMTLGMAHPMGPLALIDLIGLDTTLAILEVLHRELGDPKYRACPLLRQYVAAGWLGRKSGRGFYEYNKG
jgi:3-hydroxybutyryl-CoA dehydrogenase